MADGPSRAPGESAPRRVLIDSDAKNEIDDQYAIVRALIAPELEVEGLTAAGFTDRRRGAQRSYDEEVRILQLLGLEGSIPVALGSALPLADPQTPRITAAAELIVERARAGSAEDPLWVLGLGQFTNLASALLLAPDIRDRVVFACIDGSYSHGQSPAWGAGIYNWPNDVAAVKVLFESAVPYVHMPAPQVSGAMKVRRREVARQLERRGPVFDFLISLWPRREPERVLWDVALVHVVIDPAHGHSLEVGAPTVHGDGSTTDRPDNPRRITVYTDIDPKTIWHSYWQAVSAQACLRRRPK